MAATYRASSSDSGYSAWDRLCAAPALAAGDLLVVVVAMDQSTDASMDVTDDNPDGLGTYYRAGQVTWGGAFGVAGIFVREALVTDTTATTIALAVTDGYAGVIEVLAFAGMERVGVDAVRAHGFDSEGEAQTSPAAVPSVTLDRACLTGNPTIAALACSLLTDCAHPMGVGAPTGWTERQDVVVTDEAPDVVELATCTRDSGYTGSGWTWPDLDHHPFATMGVELDGSAAPATTHGRYWRHRRRGFP